MCDTVELVVVYRPPSPYSFFDEFSEFLSAFVLSKEKIIVMWFQYSFWCKKKPLSWNLWVIFQFSPGLNKGLIKINGHQVCDRSGKDRKRAKQGVGVGDDGNFWSQDGANATSNLTRQHMSEWSLTSRYSTHTHHCSSAANLSVSDTGSNGHV